MKHILVAGGGHGGIAAAALLANRGYRVTVLEQKSAGTLGYDWTDIFAPGALAIAGLPMPPRETYSYKDAMTFYAPGFHTGLRQEIPPEKREIKMERRDIYAHLISNAERAGVKFIYDCKVLSPLLRGSRVVGVRTSCGAYYGDLIIDACGIDSPVKNGLPSVCGVHASVGKNNQFYVYRAFYDRATQEPVADAYKVCLFPAGELGVGWIATEEDHTDLLIGRFAPFDQKEADRVAAEFRKTNPSLGTRKLRGGQFVKIPVRAPLSRLVCDGYAAIGDAAYMTVPIIGSGIANSLKAARMLVDTILADRDGALTAETLWNYQRQYYHTLGNSFAALACIKEALTVLTPSEVDALFDRGILNARDLSIDADTTGLTQIFSGTDLRDIKQKLDGILQEKALLKKLMPVAGKLAAVTAVTAAMPRRYSTRAVNAWVKRYEHAIQIPISK